MDIKKVWTGDYTSEGYNDGLNRSNQKSSKPKNKLTFFTAAHPMNIAGWQFSNAFKSYATGYDTGYDDGLRKKHDIFQSQSSSIGGSSMSGGQLNLETQLMFVQEFNRNLDILKDYLSNTSETYKNKINEANSFGANSMAIQYVDVLQNKHNEFDSKINELMSLIESQQSRVRSDHEDKLTRLIEISRQE
ncbi:MAG: hypothetical protein HOG49_15725 [Candidatus Scalindua sp.]|jgi:hypothetical protein|nr:hypothetical protein [Candidatus Scalindua sp.]